MPCSPWIGVESPPPASSPQIDEPQAPDDPKAPSSPILSPGTPTRPSSLDVYQPSDYSDFEEDPFFGADFSGIFRVDDPAPAPGADQHPDVRAPEPESRYPLTPNQTSWTPGQTATLQSPASPKVEIKSRYVSIIESFNPKGNKEPCSNYGCPYRKRNPLLFDGGSCVYGQFPTVAAVVEHLTQCHDPVSGAGECPRCKSWLSNHQTLAEHLKAGKCQNARSRAIDDYDRGLNYASFEKTFQDFKNEAILSDWECLWRALFRNNEVMDPHYIPPVTDASTQTYSRDSRQTSTEQESQVSQSEEDTLYRQSKPIVDSKAIVSGTNSLQQVGLARIRVEILSLSDKYRHLMHDDDETMDESAEETDNEGYADDDCRSGAQDSQTSSENVSTTTVNSGIQAQTYTSADQSTLPCRRTWSERENEEDEDGNNRQRKRPRRKLRDTELPRGRFACPYQAYEPWRNCFRPSQRNPKGGCDNISRLRDHMTRKHMPSYRCRRCWKHFNARQQVLEHEQGDCIQKVPPEYERFMTPEQERELDHCGEVQPVDTWWKMFRLLVPGMALEDFADLKTRYFPYYVYIDMSLTTPAMNLSNISFQHEPTPSLSQADGNEATTAFLDTPSNTLGFDSTNLTSQSLTVPIFGAAIPQLPSIPSFQSSIPEAAALCVAQQSSESDSTAPSDTINVSSTPASSLNLAQPSSTTNTSQMRRNYDRLKLRASQTDAENGELRETISTAREELRTAGELLEEVLGMDNLEVGVYEQLSRAAEILIRVTGRLK
ncbi:hypothetical protein CEP51_007291 [Fusarium floridanum]|uniref:C2H2-type domain-containing protein n=1 Tax=Fusarium floridanum TaxID=1325733 RepID=A0A428RPQ9_9HYPO|nr:hypothetical protein CEP51_007291 [Fusarium floridanum]